MSLIGKLGEKLRTTREAKGYSIREVSSQTHISPKFLEALEKEDYTIFPSETYTIGFLRTYSEFLGLNTDEILKMYNGLKVQVSETPVEELTKITKTPSMDLQTLLKYVIMITAGIIFIFLTYKVSDFFISRKSNSVSFNEIPECSQREIKKIDITGKKSFLSIIDISSKYAISYNDLNFEICLSKIHTKNNKNIIELEISSDNKKNIVEISEMQNTIIYSSSSNLQPELIVRKIFDKNAEIEILVSEKNPVSTKQQIIIYLEILGDSYIEWEADGKYFPGVILTKGENRIITADTKIDLKIGNAGGVSIKFAENPPKIIGPPGKIARVIYRKVQDPLDPTKTKIQEEIQVAQ